MIVKRSFSNTRAVFSNFWAEIVMILISYIVSRILAPLDLFNLRAWTQDETLIGVIYFFFVFFVIFLFVWLFNLVLAVNENERYKRITRLSEHRNEGVHLRTRGNHISKEEEVEPWIAEYESWFSGALFLYKEVNPARAAQWETIDTHVPFLHGNVVPVNEKHEKFLTIFNTRLTRLKNEIDEMLDLIDKEK